MLNVLELMQNKKFVPGGRGPVEYDCFGLCAEVYRKFGIALPTDYAAPVEPEERNDIIRGAMDNATRFLKLTGPEIPCLVAIMIRPPFVTHVGVVIGPSQFIHILEGPGVCVMQLTHIHWQKRIAGFYRYIGATK
jgi:hypothetical protein